MTALEKAATAIAGRSGRPWDDRHSAEHTEYLLDARAAIESLRTPGVENTDRIFNAMLDRILKEEV